MRSRIVSRIFRPARYSCVCGGCPSGPWPTSSSFLGASAVAFGSAYATSFTVASDTELLAVAPAGTGSVDVRVTTPSGTSATGSSGRRRRVRRWFSATFAHTPCRKVENRASPRKRFRLLASCR